MNTSKAQTNLLDPIFVDCFSGGGGWSTGAELALGRPIDIAVNHDPDAVLMHKTNHPYTKHYCENIYAVNPKDEIGGRHVAWAHFSPDCTHHSRAKGGTPVKKNIRGLAWVILRWAAEVRPDVISLENVEEFKNWGPVRKGRPAKSKAGQTFAKWKSQLEALGYVVEYRVLVACDYGAPTSRKRLFVIARCDGKAIVWPEPTHGDPKSEAVKSEKLLPWAVAADIIDWSLPAPSIFSSKKEIKEQYGLKSMRPLADNTMRRIIRGVNKFVINSDEPFIMSYEDMSCDLASNVITVNHAGEFRGQDLREPLQTVTMKHGYGVASSLLSPVVMANNENAAGSSPAAPAGTTTTGGHQMLVVPSLTAIGQTGGEVDRCRSVKSPVHTTVTKSESCMVAPSLIQYHTEQSEQVRAKNLGAPMMTIDTAGRHGLTLASLTKYYGNDQNGQNIKDPIHTITTRDREGLQACYIAEYHGQSNALSLADPVPTTLSNGHEALVTPYMSKFFSGGYTGSGVKITSQVPTITAVDHNALVMPHVVKMKDSNLGHDSREPVQTITASGQHFGALFTTVVKMSPNANLGYWPQIRELLNRYCSYNLKDDEILLLAINEFWYYIADIGLRMLSPRELYSANGFPYDYIIDRDYLGRAYPKTKQVARCGNAVPPPFATAIIKANAPEYCVDGIRTMRELNEQIAV